MKILFLAGALLAGGLHAQVIRTNTGFSSQQVERNDDGSSEATTLGFTINFFGKIRNSVYVNNNGNLTFDAPLATYTPFGLQKTSREIIAPYFADVDTRGPVGKLVTFGRDKINGRNAFAANYIDVGYYNRHDDKLNRFQVVVIDRSDTGAGNFTLEFNYEKIVWETGDASGGVNGFGGVPATVGWSNGSTDFGTQFELPGSMVAGAFLNSGPRALVRAHLNTSQIGRLVFQARDGVISPGLTVQGGPVLPDGTVGEPYGFAFSAVGVETAVQWDLVPDLTLPPGLRFSNGQLTGTPTAPGTYSFTVSAVATVEGEQVTVSQRGTVTISVPKMSIRTACPVPSGTVGQMYSARFSAVGPASAVWSVNDRNLLPPGLVLSPGGVLSGAPAAAGNYSFVVQVAANDSLGTLPAEKSCTLAVSPSTVRLVSGCALPDGTVGVPYAQTLVPDGGVAPYRFTLLGQLPLGLSMSTDGRVTGLPQVATGMSFDVQMSDARSTTLRQACTIGVREERVHITSACPLPRGTTGMAYAAPLTASSGFAPYTWSVAGTLPPGLSLSASGDRIAGTPMAVGPYTFRLVATDSAGQQVGMACSLPVVYGSLGISGCPLPEAVVGTQYRFALRPAGGSQPFTWTLSGAMPPGLQLSADGVVEGRLITAGDFQFGVALRDNSLLSVAEPCSMKVRPLSLRVADLGAPAVARIGQPYSTRFQAAGGLPPYRFEYFGYLPDGLTGAADGIVSGTPTRAGTTSFGVRVTDAAGTKAEAAAALEVGVPGLPSIRISAIPATLPGASADVRIGVELDNPYTLPISGQLVLSLVPLTRNLAANANQADPHVRFANGQLVTNFTIPAGAKRTEVALLSTGTVAITATVSLQNTKAGGVEFPPVVAPQLFEVRATVPVLNSACFVKTDYGTQIRALGSTTTRELTSAELKAGTVARTSDLSGVSTDYFANDGTIRFGGAFSLVFDADAAFLDVAGPYNVRVSNAIGSSAVVVAQKCP